jgi:hypothetical protein
MMTARLFRNDEADYSGLTCGYPSRKILKLKVTVHLLSTALWK